MKLIEYKLYKPVKDWFTKQGYEVRPEFPCLGRSFDGIAVRGNIVAVFEMKMSLTKQLFHQIYYGSLFADYSYAAVGTDPRNVDLFAGKGIGVLSIKNGEIREVFSPQKINTYIESRHQFAIDFVKKSKDEGIGGMPFLKGAGPAQRVEKAIIEYREKLPDATWKELWENIPNHYCNYRSMQGAMSMLKLRQEFPK